MSRDEDDVLLEAAMTAYRERGADGRIQAAAAWWDLSPDQREELFALQATSRELERALDPERRSGTVKAVLERLERA